MIAGQELRRPQGRGAERRLRVLQQPDLAVQAGTAPVYDSRGHLVASRETPARIRRIAAGLGATDRHAVPAPWPMPRLMEALHRVHDPAMLAYLRHLSAECPEGGSVMARAFQTPGTEFPTTVEPATWDEALTAAQVTLQAADLLARRECDLTYALVRPPGHHAGRDFFGAYCFVNNAAVAARHLQAVHHRRPAVLDLDYHAGDGTMDCLAGTTEIGFASIHRSTAEAYPYCPELRARAGHQWMFGLGGDVGADRYLATLDHALSRLAGQGADCLIVSIGYDIVAGDPHGGWTLPPDIFRAIGRRLGVMSLPLLMVQEGGYGEAAMTDCAAALVAGLQDKEENDGLR